MSKIKKERISGEALLSLIMLNEYLIPVSSIIELDKKNKLENSELKVEKTEKEKHINKGSLLDYM